MRDDTVDRLNFIDVARTIAGPLAAKNYLPAKNPNKTKLLVMVYWGMTTGAIEDSSSGACQNAAASQRPVTNARNQVAESHQSYPGNLDLTLIFMENRLRDLVDVHNAGILGYDSTGMIGTDYGRGLEMTALRFRERDLIDEIEDNRYFVVLMAYDFPLMWKQKKHKLLWETRYSIRQWHNDFDKQLLAMTEYASQYFGQDTKGLIRKPIPEGKVEVGEPKVIDFEPEKK